MSQASLPEAHADEGADYPFVLVDGDGFVVEEGVAHHEGGSGKVARREVIDDGSCFPRWVTQVSCCHPGTTSLHSSDCSSSMPR